MHVCLVARHGTLLDGWIAKDSAAQYPPPWYHAGACGRADSPGDFERHRSSGVPAATHDGALKARGKRQVCKTPNKYGYALVPMDPLPHGFATNVCCSAVAAALRSEGDMVTWLHGYMATWLHGYMVTWLHGYMAATSLGICVGAWQTGTLLR